MSRPSSFVAGAGFDGRVDESLQQWMVAIRRHLHRYPELSFEEHRTAAFIRQKLAELGIAAQSIGGTGVVADLGSLDPNLPCVALRADMDALPIQEGTGLPFCSDYPGKMHACGHDGHVAMLLGAASLLQRVTLPGRVRLVFQPAEEHGNGGARLVENGVLEGVQAIFAGHIDTHFQTNEITVDEGIICAYADPFRITVRGHSGHAARPHEATDAIVAAASLVMTIQTLVSREVDPNRAVVITVGSIHAGSANNVIAGEAVLTGTIRSTDEKSRQRTITGLRRVVTALQQMHDVDAELIFEDQLPAVINTRLATDLARLAAWETTTVDKVISQGYPSLGGEDFAFYQQQVEGCLVRFGANRPEGSGPAHSDTFMFDESCLEIGARWLATVAWRWLCHGTVGAGPGNGGLDG